MTQSSCATGGCSDRCCGQVDNDKYDTGGCSDRCYKVVLGQVDNDKYDTGGCSDRCLC